MTDGSGKQDAVNHGHDHSDHHHAEHGHDHAGHSHAPTVSAGNERVVLIGFLLTAGFMVAEVVAGLINAVTLFALVGWIIYEAIQRFMTPHEVLAGPMLVVAILGLVVNLVVFFVLSRGDKAHVNIQGAMVHVLGDLLGSVAAIVAAVTIWLTGWMPVDPLLSVLVSLLILRSAWALFRNSLHILMEGTPGNVVIEDLSKALVAQVPGLKAVRHVHVWSITSGKPVATLEIVLAQGANAGAVTQAVKQALGADYGITHSTVEIVWDADAPSCALAPDGVP